MRQATTQLSFDDLGGGLLSMSGADVGRDREKARLGRWVRLTVLVWLATGLLAWRGFAKATTSAWVPFPHINWVLAAPFMFFAALIVMVVVQLRMNGRSPHVLYSPDQISTRLDDVVGIDGVKEEAVRSLNLFLAHKTFAEQMGGKSRRGILFEGPPGTGKTHLARAMAAEAGVPFLFVSGTSFVSQMQGASSRKVRSYFTALRKAALKHGGAIGFIEEIDVIAQSRSGMAMTSHAMTSLASTAVGCCSGTQNLPTVYAAGAAYGTVTHGLTGPGDSSSIVNELLVQMQSFDALSGGQKVLGGLVQRVNAMLPSSRQLKGPKVRQPNVLIVAATNRASSLDPALLRPGRFDRRIGFELPQKSARRELIDFFLAHKSHHVELGGDEKRDALSAITMGYSPAMLENLLDEALINAVRRGSKQMNWVDVEHARMAIEVGVGQPVEYTDHERLLIATHEAGHATMAYLVAPQRRLEILTIIKRKGALGMLAHGDREDVYTRSRTEMAALIQIAMGGQCAEQLFFGDVSTGPGGDLLFATNAAAEMIGAHGMEASLISYLAVQNSAFSDTNIVGRVLADPQGRAATDTLLHHHKAIALELLSANRHLVEALRDALLEHDELIGHEITDVLNQASTAPVVVDLRDAAEVEQTPAP